MAGTDYSKVDYSKYSPDLSSNKSMSHIAPPPQFLLRIQVIQAREIMLHEWEKFDEAHSRNSNVSIVPLRTKVRTLFMYVQAAIKRDYTSDKLKYKRIDYLTLVKKIELGDRRDLISAIYELNEYLDMKFLTRFDTKMNYDHSKAYLENEFLGE